MSVHYLKIKVTSLAAEIKLIRREERLVKVTTKRGRRDLGRLLKTNELTEAQRKRIERKLQRSRDAATSGTPENKVFWGLRWHRRELSEYSREAQLAYAFLRGRSYRSVERDARSSPNWERVYGNVTRFGITPAEKDRVAFDAWRKAE